MLPGICHRGGNGRRFPRFVWRVGRTKPLLISDLGIRISDWNEPEKFNPNRWLNEEGKYVPGKNISFLVFSAGRRVCIAEALAKSEIFILIGRMIRDYKMEVDQNEPFPSLEPINGATLSPVKFKLKLTKRD